jgi:hypothetical protein
LALTGTEELAITVAPTDASTAMDAAHLVRRENLTIQSSNDADRARPIGRRDGGRDGRRSPSARQGGEAEPLNELERRDRTGTGHELGAWICASAVIAASFARMRRRATMPGELAGITDR